MVLRRCRQANGDLVIFNPTLAAANQLRSIPSFTEFQIHPRPGVWWWVQCVTFETGGAGMGISKCLKRLLFHIYKKKNVHQIDAKPIFLYQLTAGVQKPGGDSGIDPNALKSLVG